MFYTYVWLREDGTPYYVGKGKGNRALAWHQRIGNPPEGRVIIYVARDEADAFETEIALIWYYGRKDLGTGCLRNLTDGGEGVSGHNNGKLFTEEHRQHLSTALKGNRNSEGNTVNVGRVPWNKGKTGLSKGTKQSKEHIAKRVAVRIAKGNYSVPEERKHRISEATKLAMARPEVKAKTDARRTTAEEKRILHRIYCKAYKDRKKAQENNSWVALQ
jgi:hypothetical protein